jgi:8-oxo-dGTP pyrophosphatase MutT (NUDIX family)
MSPQVIHAACALIVRPAPLGAPLEVLTTSRRDDPAAIGLPGGKRENVDRHIIDTAVRETFEEAGVVLFPASMWPIYTGPCNRGLTCITYFAARFDLTQLGPKEPGVHIAWRPLLDLMHEPAPFWEYNRELFRALI